MATKTLVPQSGVVQAYSIVSFSGTDNIRSIQFNPQVNVGFTGSITIEGSYAGNPGANDFVSLASVTFTGHTKNLTLEIESDHPSIRAVIRSSQVGAISVFASSRRGTIQGSQGATPATAVIDSALRVAGVGSGFSINSPVVPSITTDDVYDATNTSVSLTQFLYGGGGAAGLQSKIGEGEVTASDTDLNLMTGMADYGLLLADFQKLADVTVTATEINRLAGVTSNVQTQINTINAALPDGIADQTTTGAVIDAFFDVAATVTVADLNNFSGLTATSADLNPLTGAATHYTLADVQKLGDITASAAELNVLDGFTGAVADLNKVVGYTGDVADLNAIDGLGDTTVTATEFGYLSGLTENVQTALDAIPNLSGLSASVNDLNTLTGIFGGTGSYSSGSISATEVSYLNGVTSNLQTQLDAKRNSADTIGLNEISGVSVTTTELNRLSGVTSNVQSQIDSLSSSAITATGGTFTAPIFIDNGTAAAPGLGFEAPNGDTGLYLFGADGLGITVAGARFASFDGTNMVIGTGSANGSPTLKGTGMGVSAPAYAFTNDPNTGVYWVGADSIGLAAGGEGMMTLDATANQITLGGNTANNNKVTINGVFAGEKVLGRATVQAGSVSGATGQTTLYTVPAGRSAIVTKIMVRLTAVTNHTDASLLRMNIGYGVSYDEIVDNTSNTTLFNPGGYTFNTVGQVMPLGVGDNTFPAISGASGGSYSVLTAATVLKTDVTVQAGADDFTMEVIVFGHEFA